MNAQRCLLVAGWCLIATLLLAPHSHAQPEANSLQYRKVFVPVDRLEEVTSGYIPVKTEVFQELLSELGSAASHAGATDVHLLQANYSARLEQNNLVLGKAIWRISHDNREEAVLSLAPCSFACSNATWTESRESARLGTDASGKLAIVIEPLKDGQTKQESQLTASWTQRGARDPAGSLVFDLQVPMCPTAQLALDLPRHLTPSVTNGLAFKSEQPLSDPERQEWKIEIGGRTQTTLTLTSEDAAKRRQRYVLATEAVDYEITAEALQTTVQQRLDVFDESLRQLNFAVDPALRVVAVTLDGSPVSWNLIPVDAASASDLVVEFREPLTGPGRTLKIEALASAPLNKRWTLPRILPRDVVWQAGEFSLEVESGLELCSLAANGARQVETAAGGAQQSSRFEAWTAQASLEVCVRQRAPRLECQEGLTLKWDGPHLTGRLVSHFTAQQGSRFDLIGLLAPGWIIDSVESVPATLLDDWTVGATGRTTAPLTLRLAQSVTPDRPAQITITGHRRAPARNERLRPDEYRFVQWNGLSEHRRLVSVQTESQQQLTVLGDLGLQRIDARSLTEAERSLLETSLSRVIFSDSSVGRDFFLTLRDETPRFTSQSISHITLSRESLAEKHSIRIVPDATPITRIVVRFSAVVPGIVQWRQDQESPGDVTARQLAADDSELWELTFLRPQTNPVTVVAERQTILRPGDPPRALPLIGISEAESQQGEVIVQAADGAQPVVRQLGLSPIMSLADGTEKRFRYQFAPDQKLAIEHSPSASNVPLAWIWRHELVARIDATNAIICTSNYRVENAGEPRLILDLPLDAQLRQVKVNGARLPVATSAAQRLVIPLPESERYPFLQVEYSLPTSATRLWQVVDLPHPQASLPTLEECAQLWLAPQLNHVDSRSKTPGTWRTRLFGPLARPAGVTTPSLFAQEAWLPTFQAHHASKSQIELAANLLTAMNASLSSHDPALTWGVWLARLADEIDAAAPGCKLKVDSTALADRAIYKDTPLSAVPILNAQELLSQAGLVFVLDDALTITARLTSDSDRPVTPINPALLVASPLGDKVASQNALLLDAWLATPQPVRSPWMPQPLSISMELEAAGWKHYRLASTEHPLQIQIYRWEDIQALAWGCLLLATGLTAWIIRHHPRTFALIATATGIVALWLPIAIAPFATACFLGSIFGGLIGALLPRGRRVSSSTAPDVSRHSHRAAPALTALTLFLAIACSQTFAQQAVPRSSEVYRVLVPTDDEQKPVGSYLYLPKPFYDLLVRQSNNAKAIPQGWIVYESSYRGQLQSAAPGKLQFGELTAAYDLEVFQAGTRVVIPIGREHVHLLEGRVTLDGNPLVVDWIESGEGFSFPVAAAGRYRLEVALRPTATIAGPREQIDLRIPALSRCTLQLRAPRDVPGIQIVGARGYSQQDEAGNWRVDLGPTPRLTIYWPSGEGEETPQNDVEATQLLWWKVQPGSVILESQWKFSSTAQALSEVRLIADPRLKLLPFDEDQPVADQSIRTGDVQAIQLTLKNPQREQTLRARFAFSNSNGVGKLVLPRVEAVAMRTTRRWLAVTTSGGIELAGTVQGSAEVLSPQEYMSAWGKGTPPASAFRLQEDAAGVAVELQPRPATTVARQALTYGIETSRVEVELEAVVQVSDGPIFQHRLQMPDDWKIDSAMLYVGDQVSPLQCGESLGGQRTLFLPYAVHTEHRLLIKATSPIPSQRSWTPPEVRLLSSDNEYPLLFVERAPQVFVSLSAHPGYEVVSDSSPAASDSPWRRVAVLRPQLATANRQIQVDIDRRAATLRAREVTMLSRQADAWQIVLDIQGEISGGRVDTLRWEVPADLGDIRINLPAQLKKAGIPGQTRQHLVAELEEPLQGKFAAQLTVSLSGVAAERLQIPELRLLDADALDTYVALPTSFEGQQLTWESRGLQPAALPRDQYSTLSDSILVMQAPSGRFQAAVKRLERVAGVPQVRLADILWQATSPTKAFGIVNLDLEPAGLQACTLHMPEGQTLVHVAVNGVPTVAVATETGSDFVVDLQHDQLPQHLEVTFVSDLQTTRGVRPLEAPVLRNIPVERSLWTVSCPPGVRMQLTDDVPSADSDRLNLFRIRNAATLLEQAASHAGEGAGDQITAWFAHWSHRNVQLQAVAMRYFHNEPSATNLSAEFQSVMSEAQAMGQQWGASEQLANAAREATRATSQFMNSLSKLPSDHQIVQAMLPGSVVELPLTLSAAAPPVDFARFAGVLIAIVVFLTCSAILGNQLLQERLFHTPQVVGVSAGIFWWLFLAPAGLGLLIALIFTIATVRWPWSRMPEFSGSHGRALLGLPRSP